MKLDTSHLEKPDTYPPLVYAIGPLVTEVHPVKTDSGIEPHDFWLETYHPENVDVRHTTYFAHEPSDLELIINATNLGGYSLKDTLNMINTGNKLYFLTCSANKPPKSFLNLLIMADKAQREKLSAKS